MKIKLFDILIVAFVLCISGGLAFVVYAGQQGQPFAHIKSQREELIYPLNVSRIIDVRGPLGTTVVQIADNRVQILSSPCQEKICVKAGKIHRPGEWIACLPNQVLITIEGKGPQDVDAQTY